VGYLAFEQIASGPGKLDNIHRDLKIDPKKKRL